MSIKEIKYYFMSYEKISKRLDQIKEELNNKPDHKKMMKLIDEDFSIMKAVIRRNKRDKGFMEYVKNSIDDVIKDFRGG